MRRVRFGSTTDGTLDALDGQIDTGNENGNNPDNDLVIRDSTGTIVARYNESATTWQLEQPLDLQSNNVTNVGALDTETASIGNQVADFHYEHIETRSGSGSLDEIISVDNDQIKFVLTVENDDADNISLRLNENDDTNYRYLAYDSAGIIERTDETEISLIDPESLSEAIYIGHVSGYDGGNRPVVHGNGAEPRGATRETLLKGSPFSGIGDLDSLQFLSINGETVSYTIEIYGRESL